MARHYHQKSNKPEIANCLPMPKFAVIVQGKNCTVKDISLSDQGLRGFYVTAFVEAASEGAAAKSAIECVREQLDSKAVVASIEDTPPCLLIDEFVCLNDWPKSCTRPLTGFVFYDETNEGE